MAAPKNPSTDRRRGRGARDPNRPANIDAQRRQNLAMRLFMAGQTSFEAIANTPDPERDGAPLYANRGSAHKAVQRAINRYAETDETAEARTAELMRLDALQRQWWPLALAGPIEDRDVASRNLKWIFEHRARLKGTYAPTRSQVEVITTDMVTEEIQRLTALMAADDAFDDAMTNGALDDGGNLSLDLSKEPH